MLRARSPRIACCALLVTLAACSGLSSLDEDAPPLSADEETSVRAQVDAALDDGRYQDAWNQEVAAGADRARLEAIALAALENHSRHAEDMFAALRAKHGALGGEARAGVRALSDRAKADGRWGLAVSFALTTADDPPAYAAAWALYQAAPSDRAPELLEAIRDARAEHAAGAGEGSGG